MPWLSGHEEVDAEDIRIAGCSGAAYVLWLERNLKHASFDRKVSGEKCVLSRRCAPIFLC